MRVKVNDRTQVTYEGTVNGPGDEFEAPEQEARSWLAAGFVTEVEPKAKSRPKPKGGN